MHERPMELLGSDGLQERAFVPTAALAARPARPGGEAVLLAA